LPPYKNRASNRDAPSPSVLRTPIRVKPPSKFSSSFTPLRECEVCVYLLFPVLSPPPDPCILLPLLLVFVFKGADIYSCQVGGGWPVFLLPLLCFFETILHTVPQFLFGSYEARLSFFLFNFGYRSPSYSSLLGAPFRSSGRLFFFLSARVFFVPRMWPRRFLAPQIQPPLSFPLSFPFFFFFSGASAEARLAFFPFSTREMSVTNADSYGARPLLSSGFFKGAIYLTNVGRFDPALWLSVVRYVFSF